MVIITLLAALLQTGGSITGVVRSQGTLDPIARANVIVPLLGISASTDANGAFRIDSLPVGRWQVEARALGYASHVLTVVSTGNGSMNLDFELAVRPLRLGGVTVSTARATTGITASALDPAGPPPIRISSAGELKYIPGVAEPDVLRALQVLPSVAAISDYSSALYVRGGASDQNVVLLDGVPIFNPYHLGGLFSAINADAVGSVDVWTGALPASQPDGLAATVQVQPRASARERTRTAGNIGLISSQLTIDAPLFGKRGAYLVSARKTYLDAMTHAAYGLGLINAVLPYGFSDVLGRVEYDLGKLGAITWSGYLNHEGIGTPERMAREINNDLDFDWGSRTSSLSVRHPLGSSAFGQARLGYSDFKAHVVGRGWDEFFACMPAPECWGPGGPPPPEPLDTTQFLTVNSLSRMLTADLDLTWYLDAHQLRVGASWNALKVRHSADFEEDNSERLLEDFAWKDRGNTFAVYLEDEWNVNERLHVRAGARLLDAGAIGRAWLPRLGARLRLNDSWAVSAGAGRYAQALRGMRNDESVVSSFVAYELFGLQPRGFGLARAEDLVLGLDWQDGRTALRIDAYAKRMSNLVMQARMLDPLDTPALILDEYRRGSGSARGLEIMARRHQGSFDVGFNYSYTQALRKVGAEEFVPRFERRHTLDLTASYGSSGKLISARLALGSGQPYTPATGVLPGFFYDGGDGFYDWGTVIVLGEHNSQRMPGYLRLDIAARKSSRKRWFGRETTVTPYVQVLNVLNSKNVLITEPGRDPLTGKPRFSYWPQFPLLPTFGLEWTF